MNLNRCQFVDVQLSVRRARKDAMDSVKKTEASMPIDEVKRQEKKVSAHSRTRS